ncbi:MAG: hypothetical protein JXA79_03370 [Deltaproteobacteria bacterium]|nr:hypothetical protein [Deltaproteobacteria bacterium]
MTKKYAIILFFIPLFILACRHSSWSFTPCFSLSSAWGESGESIAVTEKWQKLVEISAQRQIPEKDLSPLLNMIQQAADAGFPVDPFLDKALEGMAKQIAPPVIVNVLDKRLHHYTTCQEILNQIPEVQKEPAFQKQQSLTIMAESMARGVSGEELKKLSTHAPAPRSVTLANASEDLATLKALDFSSTDAQEIVQSRLQQGIYKKSSQGMALTIRQARKKGVTIQELKGHLMTNMGQRKGVQQTFPGNQHQRNTKPQSSGKGNTLHGQGNSPRGNGGNPQGGPSSRSPRQ